jgi:hypothetical protein
MSIRGLPIFLAQSGNCTATAVVGGNVRRARTAGDDLEFCLLVRQRDRRSAGAMSNKAYAEACFAEIP